MDNILEFHSLASINRNRVHQRVLNLVMHRLFSKVSGLWLVLKSLQCGLRPESGEIKRRIDFQ